MENLDFSLCATFSSYVSSKEFITLQMIKNLYCLPQTTLLTETNCPQINGKIIEHEKTKAMVKNAR